MITESWLRDSSELVRDLKDLELGEDIRIITKNRLSSSKRASGSGVAIVAKSKIRLTKCTIRRGQTELVCAVGKIQGLARKIVIICAYIPPKFKAKKCRTALDCIHEAISKAKEGFPDPLIILGFDLIGGAWTTQ